MEKEQSDWVDRIAAKAVSDSYALGFMDGKFAAIQHCADHGCMYCRQKINDDAAKSQVVMETNKGK